MFSQPSTAAGKLNRITNRTVALARRAAFRRLAVGALACLLLAVAIVRSPLSPAGAGEYDARYGDQVTRLYRTTLGRHPDPAGHAYWTNRLINGDDIASIVRGFLSSEEAARNTSGDAITDAYRWALGREPDAGGYSHWARVGVVPAVVAISDSAEHIQTTGTMPPPPAPNLVAATAIPNGWVDAGHGVYVPPVLLRIRWCESHDNYTAANRISSARGGYQFLRSSWHAYGHAAEFGVDQAHMAAPAQQDLAALRTWERSGTSPWRASAHCWR